jgi:hypothetical protein
VVIGILIALNLNTTKELKTNNAQVESILASVFKDLEKDLVHNINFQIKLYNEKDSLSKKVLSKTLKASDYIKNGNGRNLYSNLIEMQVEPYRFETNAYNRLINIIEIIPEKYMPIVEKLQDVYGDEAIVTNNVLVEQKEFLDKIQDRYQNTYNWYANTENTYYNDKVNYLLNDKQHLNDVKRNQIIIQHLLQHLNTLRQKATYAYNLIHYDLSLDLPKSAQITDMEFQTFKELDAYTGTYKDDTSVREIEVRRDQYGLKIFNETLIYRISKDLFKPYNESDLSIEFTRNTNGKVISLLFMVQNEANIDSTGATKLIKIK